MTALSDQDSQWMSQAFAAARRGLGRTRPNPPVGAVIVKQGKCVAEGHHPRAGGPHAEIVALRKASAEKAHGSTLYVTLEPCSTQGRTGACTDAILDAGIARVVYSVRDPNPQHAGRAKRLLTRAGISVTENVLPTDGEELIRPFSVHQRLGRPYLKLKLAATLDGRIADRSGTSQWITSPASRRVVQTMRQAADAIMVGVGTAIADDPSLTYRRAPKQERYRIILDSQARLPLKAKVLNDDVAHHTIVVTTQGAPESRRAAIAAKGAEVWVVPAAKGKVSLKHLFQKLGTLGLISVLCEGGGSVAHALLKADVVDELALFVAPKCIGSQGTPLIDGQGWLLNDSPHFTFESVRHIGPDLLIGALHR